jgi:hypothetical protein
MSGGIGAGSPAVKDYVASYKALMEKKIVEGFEFLTHDDFEECHRLAESELAHMHPDNVAQYGDWRQCRLEELPPGMEYFERQSGKQINREECIVIAVRDSGLRPVFRRKTRLHPIVFDTDGYCKRRWHDDEPLGYLSEIPIEKIDWRTRDKMKSDLEEAILCLADEFGDKSEANWKELIETDGETALKLAELYTAKADRVIKPSLYRHRAPGLIPTRKWLYGTKLIRGFPTLTVAPSGLGKSSKAKHLSKRLPWQQAKTCSASAGSRISRYGCGIGAAKIRERKSSGVLQPLCCTTRLIRFCLAIGCFSTPDASNISGSPLKNAATSKSQFRNAKKQCDSCGSH